VKFRSGIALVAVALALFAAVIAAGCGSSLESPSPKTVPTYKPVVLKSQVTVAHDVVYGSNKDIDGKTRVLKMDVYSPPAKARQKYPLVILLDGAGFAADSSKAQWKDRAPELASYGFVVACPDYRVGNTNGTPSSDIIETLIVQGMQDARAVVRFFRQDTTQGNRYHIDTQRIFLGGFSAGAIVTGQAVYLDTLSKADPELRKVIVDQGGLEGNTGHPGYDSSVTAWINIAGALIDPKYITSDSKPMLNIYGTKDNVVNPGGGHLLSTDCKGSGGRSLAKRAASINLNHCAVYPINGGSHTSPVEAHWEDSLARIVAFIHTFD
jgi:dienelactone hydrolase